MEGVRGVLVTLTWLFLGKVGVGRKGEVDGRGKESLRR